MVSGAGGVGLGFDTGGAARRSDQRVLAIGVGGCWRLVGLEGVGLEFDAGGAARPTDQRVPATRAGGWRVL